MTKRQTVVGLVCFNLVLIAMGLGLITLFLASEASSPRLACGNSGDQRVVSNFSTYEAFATIEEAEAFICHSIAWPREQGGWLLQQISAYRSVPAAALARGQGFASTTLDYELRNSDANLQVEISAFDIMPVTFGDIYSVRIMDTDARLIWTKMENLVVVQWTSQGFNFYTIAQLADDFSLEQLLVVLNSIR